MEPDSNDAIDRANVTKSSSAVEQGRQRVNRMVEMKSMNDRREEVIPQVRLVHVSRQTFRSMPAILASRQKEASRTRETRHTSVSISRTPVAA